MMIEIPNKPKLPNPTDRMIIERAYLKIEHKLNVLVLNPPTEEIPHPSTLHVQHASKYLKDIPTYQEEIDAQLDLLIELMKLADMVVDGTFTFNMVTGAQLAKKMAQRVKCKHNLNHE